MCGPAPARATRSHPRAIFSDDCSASAGKKYRSLFNASRKWVTTVSRWRHVSRWWRHRARCAVARHVVYSLQCGRKWKPQAGADWLFKPALTQYADRPHQVPLPGSNPPSSPPLTLSLAPFSHLCPYAFPVNGVSGLIYFNIWRVPLHGGPTGPSGNSVRPWPPLPI